MIDPTSPIVVHGTLAVQSALSQILDTIESSESRRLKGNFQAGSLLVNTLTKDCGHLFVGQEGATRTLANKGVLQAGGSTALVLSETAFAVHKSHPLNELTDARDIQSLMSEAKVLCRSTAESGNHLERIAQSMGIAEAVARKSVLPAPGELVGDVLTRSEADLGFQQISELQDFDQLKILRLPKSGRHFITYFLTPFAPSANCEYVQNLARKICSPRFHGVWRGRGLEPCVTAQVNSALQKS